MSTPSFRVRTLTIAAAAIPVWMVIAEARKANEAGKVFSCIRDLPDLTMRPHEFRSEPYLDAAVSLQRLGKNHAIRSLRVMSQQCHDRAGCHLMLLCRALFVGRGGGPLRGPHLGAAMLLGESAFQDWPRCPIEVVDGVPFLIARGYMLVGIPESPQGYLEYCIENGDWNNEVLVPQGVAERRRALDKLLLSDKWKRPLDSNEREFLTLQAQ